MKTVSAYNRCFDPPIPLTLRIWRRNRFFGWCWQISQYDQPLYGGAHLRRKKARKAAMFLLRYAIHQTNTEVSHEELPPIQWILGMGKTQRRSGSAAGGQS